jgi:hypothetical protein
MTRSRPYNKDDNAHVEQKNWTHIRQCFGYERHDNPEVVEPIAEGQFRQRLDRHVKLLGKKTVNRKQEPAGNTLLAQ